MTVPRDERAVVEYRIPAAELRTGDVVNTSPGGPDDWQQVRAVHDARSQDATIASLMGQIGDRYVLVELSDIAAVDSNVYLTGEGAMLFGAEGDDDTPVLEAVSGADETRVYLYTVHELVTLRQRE